jgi:esterase/lipase
VIKKIGIGFAIVLLVGVSLFLLGPRPPDDTTLRTVELPDGVAELEEYVAAQEAAVPGIRPGTEKTIVWADSAARTQTRVALVYVHGFTASRGEVVPLCDTLAARLGANLYYTRLTGHGRDADAMGEATLNDWLNDTYEAYQIGRRLGDDVVLIGTSMGGALVTWLTAQDQIDDPLATVTISPAYGLYNPESQQALTRVAGWPWGERILRWQTGTYNGAPSEDPNINRYWTRRYRSDALIPLAQLIDELDRTDPEQIESPLFIAYSPNDQVVHPDTIASRFAAFGATPKDTVQITESGDENDHVIAGTYRSPQTTERVARAVLDFLQPLLE